MSVHIGEWVNHKLTPKCRAVEPSSSMTGNSYESVSALADCVECVQEWMQDRCTHCNGNGTIVHGCGANDCCGSSRCTACDLEQAEDQISRWHPKPAAEGQERK